MDQWFRHFSNYSTSALIVICTAFTGLSTCILFYLIWQFGTSTIAGIPFHLILITIIFPVLVAAIIFWLARRLELAARRSEYE